MVLIVAVVGMPAAPATMVLMATVVVIVAVVGMPAAVLLPLLPAALVTEVPVQRPSPAFVRQQSVHQVIHRRKTGEHVGEMAEVLVVDHFDLDWRTVQIQFEPALPLADLDVHPAVAVTADGSISLGNLVGIGHASLTFEAVRGLRLGDPCF